MKTSEKVGLAALLTAWVVFTAHWAGELLVNPDEEVADSLRIATPEKDQSDVAEAEEEPPLEAPADLMAQLAAAAAGDGEGVFKKCGSCHTIEEGGANKVGPNLWNVVGREKAAVDGFSYSEALTGLGGAWTPENLYKFLYKPKEYAPGNKMSFKGLSKQEDRVDLIAYMNTMSSSPMDFAAMAEAMPAPEPASDEEAPADTAAEGMVEQAVEAAEEAVQAVEQAAGEAVEAAGETAEQAMQATEEAAGEAATSAEEMAKDAAKAATDAAQAVSQAVSDEAASAGGVAEDGLSSLVAAASPDAGEKAFRKCKACHTVDEGGANRVGPNLWNIINAEKAAKEGYKYSDALAGMGGSWTLENLNNFIADPKGYVPGTKMSFKGVADEKDRADIISYLNQNSSSPLDF